MTSTNFLVAATILIRVKYKEKIVEIIGQPVGLHLIVAMEVEGTTTNNSIKWYIK